MKKIYIGIGHGGTDPGACANGLRESDLNLALGFLVQTELRRCGVEARMSRTGDTTFPTASKVADANAWGADAVIDIHHNAGGGVGFEVYRSQNADGSEKLAKAISEQMDAIGRKNRGVKTYVSGGADYFGIIRQTKAPAILIEYGFIDNAADVAFIKDAAQRLAWAQATAKGLCAALGVDYAPASGGAGAAADPGSALTAIMGTAVAGAERMRAYLMAQNPAAPDYAQIYLEEGAAEGVRGDIAFVQSCLETGYWKFGGDVKAEQNNFCGLGATGGGEPGNRFATPREGIRAQIQHLKAYASTAPLNQNCVDPRFQYVSRGCAEYLEHLGQKENPAGKGWAAGAGYGGKIMEILNAILSAEAPTQTDELDALRRENARLRSENEALTATINAILALMAEYA